jgi:hypothetical protein
VASSNDGAAMGEDMVELTMPEGFTLDQNYPNPFNPLTTISFSLETGTDVRLEVFNILGQSVEVLHDGFLASGRHTFDWNGSNYASGLYFYNVKTETISETRKMILLK